MTEPTSSLLEIGGYKFLERLPDRPSGREFKALDPRSGKPIAVRLVNPDWLRPADDAANYLQRVRAGMRMNHPSQVNVLDAGLVGETLYIVQELVDGASLAALVNEMGPLPVELACDYARQAAAALQAAHEGGIFHGDFSPARMILAPVIRASAGPGHAVSTRPAPGATVKVEDIGLIPRRPPAAQISTNESHLLGSLHYLAPERFTTTEATARGDIYSLGASLYFLLSGRPPSAIDFSVDSLSQMQQGSAVRIDSLRKDVGPALAELIHRMLAVDPNARPASAASVIQYLWPVAHAPQAAPSPGPPHGAPEYLSPESHGLFAAASDRHENFLATGHESLAFGSAGTVAAAGEHDSEMFTAEHAPSPLRAPSKQPREKRWGMIILAIALHVIALGTLALYLLKAGPFAVAPKEYKRPDHPKSKSNH